MIYLDFEGYMRKEPSLVGYLIDGEFTQFILDEEFLPIAQATDIKFKNYKKFSKEILAMSNKLGRPIVSCSERELDQFEEFEIPFVYLNLRIKIKLHL